jgi:hypothetical protein
MVVLSVAPTLSVESGKKYWTKWWTMKVKRVLTRVNLMCNADRACYLHRKEESSAERVHIEGCFMIKGT